MWGDVKYEDEDIKERIFIGGLLVMRLRVILVFVVILFCEFC